MNFEIIRQAFKNKADAALITGEVTRFYLTGFAASDGYFLITRDKTVLFADGRYIEAASKKAENCDEILLYEGLSETVVPTLERLSVKKLMTESDRMTVSRLKSLSDRLPVEVFADAALDGAIDALRSVKTEREIDLIKKAQGIAERAFEHILGFIQPGRTEREIGLELDFYMLSNGADALSFETIALSGANTSLPHGTPSNKRVERGDFVTMDYGAVVGGYHSDMTRTVAVGYVSDEQARVYETVLRAQQAAFSAMRPGVQCRAVDAAARGVTEAAGYGECFSHGLGHGVGVEIHEKPALSKKSEGVLEKGNVVTNEPGIYITGKFGVRIEDMALITADGYENLTGCEKRLIVV